MKMITARGTIQIIDRAFLFCVQLYFVLVIHNPYVPFTLRIHGSELHPRPASGWCNQL